jgi:hypothetical protein
MLKSDFTGSVEQLPFPHTLPKNTQRGFEMMRVIEDTDDDCKIHVALADVMNYPRSWGRYLSEVARAIARDHGEDALADLREGFTKAFEEK